MTLETEIIIVKLNSIRTMHSLLFGNIKILIAELTNLILTLYCLYLKVTFYSFPFNTNTKWLDARNKSKFKNLNILYKNQNFYFSFSKRINFPWKLLYHKTAKLKNTYSKSLKHLSLRHFAWPNVASVKKDGNIKNNQQNQKLWMGEKWFSINSELK